LAQDHASSSKPVVLLTGAAGDIGSALADALAARYEVIGLDRPGRSAHVPLIDVDLTSLQATTLQTIAAVAAAIAIIALSLPRGRVQQDYSDWNRRIR
jgi:nucleoside-diphosphate-sugar epimerase